MRSLRMKRLACIFTVPIIAACGTENTICSESDIADGNLTDDLLVSSKTDKDVHAPGENMHLSLRVVNVSDQEKTVVSSGPLYDFVAVNAAGEVVWKWSYGVSFLAVVTSITLEPCETYLFPDTNDGIIQQT